MPALPRGSTITVERRLPDAAPMAKVAVAAGLFDLAVLVVFHVLRPDVSPIDDPTSNYAVGSYGLLSSLATFAVGIGALALAVALRRSIPRGLSRSGIMLLVVFGVSKLLQAFFPIDIDPDVATTTAGSIHNLIGNIAFFALPIATVLISRSLEHRPNLWAWLLVGSAVVVLVTGLTGGFGLAQRLYLVLSSVWIVIVGLELGKAATDDR